MLLETILFSIFSILFSLFLALPLQLITLLGGALPHLILLLILFTSIERGPNTGMLVATISGMYFDITGIFPLGYHLLLFNTLAFFIGTFRGLFLIDKIIGPILVSMLMHLIYLIFAIVLGLVLSLLSLSMVLRIETLLEILYTALFAPIMYIFVIKLTSYLEMRPGGRYR